MKILKMSISFLLLFTLSFVLLSVISNAKASYNESTNQVNNQVKKKYYRGITKKQAKNIAVICSTIYQTKLKENKLLLNEYAKELKIPKDEKQKLYKMLITEEATNYVQCVLHKSQERGYLVFGKIYSS